MKITKESNWHVNASPGNCYSEERAYEYCQDIEEEIKRHCDSVADTEIECDTEDVCEFCGENWDNFYGEDWDGDEDNAPFCCNKAKEDYEKSKVCVKCQETNSWGWAFKMHRCKKCNEWFCNECIKNSNKCEECLEKIRREKDEKKRPPGRRVRL